MRLCACHDASACSATVHGNGCGYTSANLSARSRPKARVWGSPAAMSGHACTRLAVLALGAVANRRRVCRLPSVIPEVMQGAPVVLYTLSIQIPNGGSLQIVGLGSAPGARAVRAAGRRGRRGTGGARALRMYRNAFKGCDEAECEGRAPAVALCTPGRFAKRGGVPPRACRFEASLASLGAVRGGAE